MKEYTGSNSVRISMREKKDARKRRDLTDWFIQDDQKKNKKKKRNFAIRASEE